MSILKIVVNPLMRGTLDIVIWIYVTFGNNLKIKNDFTGRVFGKVLMNNTPFKIFPHLIFSLKYLAKITILLLADVSIQLMG